MVTGISFSNHLMKLWFKLLFETAVEFDILRYALLLRIRNSCKIFNISSLFILFIYNIKLLQIEFYYLWNNRIICTKKWILARHKKIRKTKVENRTVWRKRSHKFVKVFLVIFYLDDKTSCLRDSQKFSIINFPRFSLQFCNHRKEFRK